MQEQFVETPEQLQQICSQLRGSEWLAIDTEFIREKTYYPRLCLIQVCNGEVAACIDPLALQQLDPLIDILYDGSILKVLHAARQDLEIFYYLRGSVPCPVFDTQIAATVLGYGDQIGYSTLIEEFSGIKLDKAHARTD